MILKENSSFFLSEDDFGIETGLAEGERTDAENVDASSVMFDRYRMKCLMVRIDCGRTDEEFMEQVRTRSALEDKIAQIWATNHNKIPSPLKMSTTPIGNRTDFFPDGYEDPGDAGLFFAGPKGSVSVDVEIKLRDWFGHNFRPREIDTNKCTAANRPYILIQNHQTDNPFLVLVKPDELAEIARKYDRRLHEIKKGKKWSPYFKNGRFEKWYYIAPDFRIYPHVPLNTLRDANGRYTTYGKIVKYLIDRGKS